MPFQLCTVQHVPGVSRICTSVSLWYAGVYEWEAALNVSTGKVYYINNVNACTVRDTRLSLRSTHQHVLQSAVHRRYYAVGIDASAGSLYPCWDRSAVLIFFSFCHFWRGSIALLGSQEQPTMAVYVLASKSATDPHPSQAIPAGEIKPRA